MFAGVDDAAGHDAVFNDFALMVDIFEEEIQRGDPLRQSALNPFPFRRRDDPEQQIVGKNPFRPLIVPIHGESNALVEEGLVSAVTRPAPGLEASCAADDIVFGAGPRR